MSERAEAYGHISEREFKEQVLTLAGYLGWRVYSTWNSIHSPAGFPDLCLCRPPRLLFIELKSDSGRVSPEQTAWLNELGRVPNVETHIFRPADLDLIRKILAR